MLGGRAGSRLDLPAARGFFEPRALEHGEELERVLILCLHDARGDGLRQPSRDRPHRLLGLIAMGGDQIGDGDRRADGDLDRRRPKRPGVVEDHADRQERHAIHAAWRALGSEGQARGARPERQQDRLRLRSSFGKDQDDAAGAERLDRRREHLLVLSRVVAGLGPSVDGHGADHAQGRADQRVVKERRVGEHRDRARDGRDDQHRVDQRVVVVRGDDHATALGNPLSADHVDPAVEQPQQQADQPSDASIGERPARVRSPRGPGGGRSRSRGDHACARSNLSETVSRWARHSTVVLTRVVRWRYPAGGP